MHESPGSNIKTGQRQREREREHKIVVLRAGEGRKVEHTGKRSSNERARCTSHSTSRVGRKSTAGNMVFAGRSFAK